MNIDTKILINTLANRIKSILKELYTISNLDTFLQCKDGSTYEKQ